VSDGLTPPFVAGLPVTSAALEFAVALHRDQRRDSDAAPFILHPLEVAILLHNRGYDDEIVAAGLLHDAVEATEATLGDVRARFGARVCGLVRALTDDPAIEDYEERKAALRAQVEAAGPEAGAIYAADKVAKARELRARLALDARTSDTPDVRRRLAHYEASARMLDGLLPGHPLVQQLRFELWALRALPPGRQAPAPTRATSTAGSGA
jgi:(p)ppGpp synthase/HD superfamily hydrolase